MLRSQGPTAEQNAAAEQMVAAEQAAKEAADRAAKEKAEQKAAAERATRERAEREAAERAKRERAEREVERERAEREAAREWAEREAAEKKAERENRYKPAVLKTRPLIEQELWNIFTYYTLHGNPLAPEYMKNQQFFKFVKDCQMMSAMQGSGMTAADLSVLLAKEVHIRSRPSSASSSSSSSSPGQSSDRNALLLSTAKRSNPTLMTYGDFLTILTKIAPRMYPQVDTSTVFQKLLLENVLPLAARRCPASVARHLEGPYPGTASDVAVLLSDVCGDGLNGIFNYYSEVGDRRRKKLASAEVRVAKDMTRGMGLVRVTSLAASSALKKDRDKIGYQEFVSFCQDFKLLPLALITTIQAGDLYLSSVEDHRGGDEAPMLAFEEFKSLLLRVAIAGYEEAHPSISLATKVKGLLLFMWKAVNCGDAATKAVEGRGGVSLCDASKSVKSGDLNLFGSSLFKRRFLEMWKRDQFRDYLQNVEDWAEDGETVLKRLLGTKKGLDLFDLNRGVASTIVDDRASVASSVMKTSKLGELLKQRPHIAEMLFESLGVEEDFAFGY